MEKSILSIFGLSVLLTFNSVAALAECDEAKAQELVVNQYKSEWLLVRGGEVSLARGAAYKYALEPGVEYRFYGFFEGTTAAQSAPGRTPFSQFVFGTVNENCELIEWNAIGGMAPIPVE